VQVNPQFTRFPSTTVQILTLTRGPQAILSRPEVGMPAALVEVLMAYVVVEDDGKIDYDKLLSGSFTLGVLSLLALLVQKYTY
jgi:hypothetical protein